MDQVRIGFGKCEIHNWIILGLQDKGSLKLDIFICLRFDFITNFVFRFFFYSSPRCSNYGYSTWIVCCAEFNQCILFKICKQEIVYINRKSYMGTWLIVHYKCGLDSLFIAFSCFAEGIKEGAMIITREAFSGK